MMTAADRYPDLDFSRAWHGGELLPSRQENCIQYQGDVDLYAAPIKRHPVVQTPCKCGCGALITQNVSYRARKHYVEGHQANYSEAARERRRLRDASRNTRRVVVSAPSDSARRRMGRAARLAEMQAAMGIAC